jgi:WD repeat-containing protein 19
VSEKYRKKIELMVRKPDRGEEPQERLAACPYCQLPGPEGELQCISCQNTIPFDIATGTHRSALSLDVAASRRLAHCGESTWIHQLRATCTLKLLQLTAVLCFWHVALWCPAGNRMTLQDWCECPSCHLPCSSQAFLAILAADGRCPMCNDQVSMHEVRQLKDPLASYQAGQGAAATAAGVGAVGGAAQARPTVALPPMASSS